MRATPHSATKLTAVPDRSTETDDKDVLARLRAAFGDIEIVAHPARHRRAA